ncbi:MAG: hypothetical protein PHY05_10570 [Methanothrix sp.]|nr:hypothetical protein [Methanothrix sp.]
MGCFEDYMQFRDEVDEVKTKTQSKGTSDECRCIKDRAENEKTSASPKPTLEKR